MNETAPADKHKKINYPAIAVAALVLIAAFILLFTPLDPLGMYWLKGHVYLGDHITIHMKINVDGEDISLSNARMTCDHEGKAQNMSGQNGRYGAPGGDYGGYYFKLVIPGRSIKGEDSDIAVMFDYMNACSWYIVGFDCAIALKKAEGGYTGTIKIIRQCNDGTKEEFTEDIAAGKDKTISVNWGLEGLS